MYKLQSGTKLPSLKTGLNPCTPVLRDFCLTVCGKVTLSSPDTPFAVAFGREKEKKYVSMSRFTLLWIFNARGHVLKVYTIYFNITFLILRPIQRNYVHIHVLGPCLLLQSTSSLFCFMLHFLMPCRHMMINVN